LFRLGEAKALEFGQDRIDRSVPLGPGRGVADPRRYIGDAQGAIGFQEDLENASGQWRKQMGAAAALIAYDEFTVPLAPNDCVRGDAAPT
jgi:hypothetical protein